MAAQFVLTFASVQRATLLFLVILFGAIFFWTALDLVDADGTLMALVVGLSLLLALAVTYLSAWLTYRTSKRLIGPVS